MYEMDAVLIDGQKRQKHKTGRKKRMSQFLLLLLQISISKI